MKKLLLLLLNFYSIFLFSQKYDNIWILGYPYQDTNLVNGSTILNFGFNPIRIDSFRVKTSFEGVVMSDSMGDLQFYCNGCKVLTKLHTIMENGDTLVSNRYWRNWCKDNFDYPMGSNGMVVVPPFGKSAIYRIIRMEDDTARSSNAVEIYQTTIDMSANNGLGKVIEKRKILVSTDTLTPHISLCKHANGRDWWLTCMRNTIRDSTNVMYSYLLTEQGLSAPIRQTFANYWNYWISADNTVFSPDGTKYVRTHRGGKVFIYDFDRCTGLFSNQRLIKDTNDTLSSISSAISSNSRFLYVSQVLEDLQGSSYIYQFDLQAQDIAASRKLVAEWDGFVDPDCWFCSSRFYYLMLAADSKIYISAPNGTKYLSVIEQPDLPGLLCTVKQHSVKLFGYSAFDLPHTPHYRLGPLKGSPCDTLLVANKEITPADYGLKLFPNPASTDIKIDITLKEFDPNTKTEVIIVDVSGASVQKYTMPDFAYIANLDISNLPGGVYGVQLRQPRKFGERILAVEKLVVLR